MNPGMTHANRHDSSALTRPADGRRYKMKVNLHGCRGSAGSWLDASLVLCCSWGCDMHEDKIEEAQCPVCGYYCLGKGGNGCIDKPSMVHNELSVTMTLDEGRAAAQRSRTAERVAVQARISPHERQLVSTRWLQLPRCQLLMVAHAQEG